MDILGDPLRHPNPAPDLNACPTARPTAKAALLRSLHERIQSVERRGVAANQDAPTCHPQDTWLNLGFGETHEWFPDRPTERGEWVPPFSILIELVKHAACGDPPRWCVWIGPRVWPYGHASLRSTTGMLRRGIFVHATDPNDRLWAMESALRCAGTVVIADASRLDTAASRRVQLAAESGGSLGIFVRPKEELATISMASTRWVVASRPCESNAHTTRMHETNARGHSVRRGEPTWEIRLVRRKGVRAVDMQSWSVGRVAHAGVISLTPNMDERSGAALAAS
jgi:protein ImuA